MPRQHFARGRRGNLRGHHFRRTWRKNKYNTRFDPPTIYIDPDRVDTTGTIAPALIDASSFVRTVRTRTHATAPTQNKNTHSQNERSHHVHVRSRTSRDATTRAMNRAMGIIGIRDASTRQRLTLSRLVSRARRLSSAVTVRARKILLKSPPPRRSATAPVRCR
jgi:hypothetical protein